MPEWKFLVCYTFRHFSELPWLLLAGGRVVHVCSVTQLCLIVCDPMDCIPLASSVQRIILTNFWSGLSFSTLEDLSNSGIKPESPVSNALRWIPFHWARSFVHRILQARILEWVAISFSRGSFQPRDCEPGSPTLQADSIPSEPPGKLIFLWYRSLK